MKINKVTWKDFKLSDHFKIYKSENVVSSILEEEGPVPYVTRTRLNNGVVKHVNPYEYKLNKGNVITIGGESAFAFYQKEDFITGNNITILTSDLLNENNAMFIVTILNENVYKYSYGRAFNKTNVEETIIPLPSDSNGEPDWNFMSSYIESLNNKKITTTIKPKYAGIDLSGWKQFRYDQIFTLQKGKRLTKEDMIEGTINYIGAVSENNGVRELIGNTEYISEGNCITVNYNGSVGEAFYQKNSFWASDDVNVLYLKNHELNQYIALFLCTIIKQEKVKFGYGRKWKLERMNESKILLPVDVSGKPDWSYMENYIKSFPYSDRI